METDKRTAKQIKVDKFMNELKSTSVITLKGTFSLFDLMYIIGIKTKVRYFNIVSRRSRKKNLFY